MAAACVSAREDRATTICPRSGPKEAISTFLTKQFQAKQVRSVISLSTNFKHCLRIPSTFSLTGVMYFGPSSFISSIKLHITSLVFDPSST